MTMEEQGNFSDSAGEPSELPVVSGGGDAGGSGGRSARAEGPGVVRAGKGASRDTADAREAYRVLRRAGSMFFTALLLGLV